MLAGAEGGVAGRAWARRGRAVRTGSVPGRPARESVVEGLTPGRRVDRPTTGMGGVKCCTGGAMIGIVPCEGVGPTDHLRGAWLPRVATFACLKAPRPRHDGAALGVLE